RMLKTFVQGGADLLLGTQMVAKGLDISHVTLVGVISADTQMRLPDFRSAERTFYLLTQVAGRAGRRLIEGEVIIQTSQPQHYCFKYVLGHDFVGFYEEEVEWRRELRYPPFGRLALVEFKGQKEGEVERVADEFARLCNRVDQGIEKLGPAPAAISKIRKNYRYHLLLKGDREHDPSGKVLHDTVRKTLNRFGVRSSVQLTVDIDPQGMM
ncbi:MAG: primosomal protein N', partial [Bacteroidota bacterium]